MIICDFDVIRVAVDERKAASPLIIYGNRVLSLSLTFQRVEPIAWRNLQVIERRGNVNVFQAAHGSSQQVGLKPFRCARCEEIPCVFVCESLNHRQLITLHVTLVKSCILIKKDRGLKKDRGHPLKGYASHCTSLIPLDKTSEN